MRLSLTVDLDDLKLRCIFETIAHIFRFYQLHLLFLCIIEDIPTAGYVVESAVHEAMENQVFHEFCSLYQLYVQVLTFLTQ
jgi:hypothetical protein